MSLKKLLTARTVVLMYCLGFAASLILQSVFQVWFASVTLWGSNFGWQNEIAFWNLGLILVLIPFLKSEENSRKVIPGLTFLFLLFGTNHAWAIHSSSHALLGNIAGATMNAIGIILAVSYWILA